MKSVKLTTALFLLVTVLFTSCSNNENVNPETAPVLPPVESMTMDLTFFGGSNIGGRQLASTHWQRAASLVGFWNAILAVNLALPVTAFKVAVNQKATYDKANGFWIWNYTYDFVGKKYTSKLTAELKDGKVELKMYISEEGGFQDALWYTGSMLADGSNGSWVLNYNGNSPTEYLKIDWTKTNGEIGDIKFTYTLENAPEKGSYIEYTESAGTEFNRSYEIYLSNLAASVNIEWDTDNGTGHIMDIYYFHDSVYHCWDTNFMDIDC